MHVKVKKATRNSNKIRKENKPVKYQSGGCLLLSTFTTTQPDSKGDSIHDKFVQLPPPPPPDKKFSLSLSKHQRKLFIHSFTHASLLFYSFSSHFHCNSFFFSFFIFYCWRCCVLFLNAFVILFLNFNVVLLCKTSFIDQNFLYSVPKKLCWVDNAVNGATEDRDTCDSNQIIAHEGKPDDVKWLTHLRSLSNIHCLPPLSSCIVQSMQSNEWKFSFHSVVPTISSHVCAVHPSVCNLCKLI